MSNDLDLTAFRNLIEDKYFELDIVTGVNVELDDTEEPHCKIVKVQIFVSDKDKFLGPLDLIKPEGVHKLKYEIIEMNPELQTSILRVPKCGTTSVPLPDKIRYDGLQGGMSLGLCRGVDLGGEELYYFVGTLGCIVKDRDTGKLGILTNEHLLKDVLGHSNPNEEISQPAGGDWGKCPKDRVGTVVKTVYNNLVDAGLVSIVDESKRGQKCEILDLGPIRGHRTLNRRDLKSLVCKRGRTTGLTTGMIKSINFALRIGNQRFRRQILIRRAKSHEFSLPGDSGSVILDRKQNIVGLLMGGSTDSRHTYTFANHIAYVLKYLNIEMCRALE